MEESTLRWPIDKEHEEMEEVCSIDEVLCVNEWIHCDILVGASVHHSKFFLRPTAVKKFQWEPPGEGIKYTRGCAIFEINFRNGTR